MKDSEFLLSLDRNVSEYNGAPYYNDQTIVFKFDLWANGTFSPFVIAETAFDEALGIKKRQNFGLGAKYRVLGDFWSSFDTLFLDFSLIFDHVSMIFQRLKIFQRFK